MKIKSKQTKVDSTIGAQTLTHPIHKYQGAISEHILSIGLQKVTEEFNGIVQSQYNKASRSVSSMSFSSPKILAHG
jgi:hypothetical protein